MILGVAAALLTGPRVGEDPFAGLARDPALATHFPACAALSGERLRACFLTSLRGPAVQRHLGAAELVSLCEALDDEAERGWCLEQAMWTEPPPPAALCETISLDRPRASCRLAAAQPVLAGAELEEALATCRALPELSEHCFAHLVSKRRERWRAGGAGLLRAEVRDLLALAPELADSEAFGKALANTTHELAGPVHLAEVCAELRAASTAQGICERVLRRELRAAAGLPPEAP